MFRRWFEKREARKDAINKARENFTSWLEISRSNGWKIYEERVNKKIEIIKDRIEKDTSLTGEDLKRLQLALQVWNEVIRIPRELEDNARGTIK